MIVNLRVPAPSGRRVRVVLACALTLGLLGSGAASAGAAGPGGPLSAWHDGPGDHHHHPSHGRTCTGTQQEPGVLSGGYFGPVTVEGVCAVNGGQALVLGDVIVRPGSALLAGFGQNDATGSGGSNLVVLGSVVVQEGGTAMLGCLPTSFPCFDDPEPEQPTLSSSDYVLGGLYERQPLGVIVHNSVIGGSVVETGGGGGVSCEPSGPFVAFHVPVYSDYEDSTIFGGLRVSGLQSCWLGLARLHVGGDVRLLGNQLADPDAIEVVANQIRGNLACFGNSQVWDSAEGGEESLFPRIPDPNTVEGRRLGQCVLSTPTTESGEPGPGPF